VYDGEFKAGRFDGHGVYTYPDGSKYIGNFQQDKRHGEGVFIDANGVKFNEEWRKGERIKHEPAV